MFKKNINKMFLSNLKKVTKFLVFIFLINISLDVSRDINSKNLLIAYDASTASLPAPAAATQHSSSSSSDGSDNIENDSDSDNTEGLSSIIDELSKNPKELIGVGVVIIVAVLFAVGAARGLTALWDRSRRISLENIREFLDGARMSPELYVAWSQYVNTGAVTLPDDYKASDQDLLAANKILSKFNSDFSDNVTSNDDLGVLTNKFMFSVVQAYSAKENITMASVVTVKEHADAVKKWLKNLYVEDGPLNKNIKSGLTKAKEDLNSNNYDLLRAFLVTVETYNQVEIMGKYTEKISFAVAQYMSEHASGESIAINDVFSDVLSEVISFASYNQFYRGHTGFLAHDTGGNSGGVVQPTGDPEDKNLLREYFENSDGDGWPIPKNKDDKDEDATYDSLQDLYDNNPDAAGQLCDAARSYLEFAHVDDGTVYIPTEDEVFAQAASFAKERGLLDPDFVPNSRPETPDIKFSVEGRPSASLIMKWRDLATEAISAKDYSQMDAILFYANITHVDYLNDEIDNMSDALRAFEAYNKATTWREGADVPEGLRDAL